jgi:hypothetical protein
MLTQILEYRRINTLRPFKVSPKVYFKLERMAYPNIRVIWKRHGAGVRKFLALKRQINTLEPQSRSSHPSPS